MMPAPNLEFIVLPAGVVKQLNEIEKASKIPHDKLIGIYRRILFTADAGQNMSNDERCYDAVRILREQLILDGKMEGRLI